MPSSRQSAGQKKTGRFGCLSSLLIALLIPVLFFLLLSVSIKFQGWLSKETYKAGDTPDEHFAVLVRLPASGGSSTEKIRAWAWNPENRTELDRSFPGWTYHRSLEEVSSYNGPEKPGFQYSAEQMPGKRKRVRLTHWTGDDATWLSVYDIEGNKIYPVSFMLKSTISYMMIGSIPAAVITILLIVLLRRFLKRLK